MKIVCKKYKNWDAKTKRILMGLTNRTEFGSYSMMRENISYNKNIDTYVCFGFGNKIVGWAIIIKPRAVVYFNHINNSVVMVYVRKENRRQGIGTKLISYVSKQNENIAGMVWDGTSGKFYKTITKSFPVKII